MTLLHDGQLHALRQNSPTMRWASSVASQPLNAVRWQTPVDLNPQYSGNDLLIHYGSPLITLANTIIVPVKTGASGGFRVEGRNGANGTLIWMQTTDYILPPHNWTPSYSPALTPSQRLYFAGAGGTVFYRDNLDANSGATGRLAFYDNCPGATVACSPLSGSTFPIGQTTVLCTGTDTSGYTATCSFKVTVRKQGQR